MNLQDELKAMRLSTIANFLFKYTEPRGQYDGITASELAVILEKKLDDVEIEALNEQIEKDAETHTGEVYGD